MINQVHLNQKRNLGHGSDSSYIEKGTIPKKKTIYGKKLEELVVVVNRTKNSPFLYSLSFRSKRRTTS